jgi:vanillate O-demethylase monooxygenase subunit
MKYVRNAWYVACWSEEVAPGTPYPATILNERVVLRRLSDGTISALEDRCVHRFAPLSLGRCEGDHLRCMYHGLLFDAAGKVIEIPGQDLIPANARVRCFETTERAGWVWIWMGDRKADLDLLPPCFALDHPDFVMKHNKLEYQAEARLINDNLCDFSHLTFVHAESFGAGELWAKTKPKVIPLPRGVRVDRWVAGDHDTITGDTIDRWERYDYLVPGIMIQESANFHPGAAERFGFDEPDFGEAKDGYMIANQAITPVTEQTAHYFFAAGPHRDHGGEEFAAILMSIVEQAFAEDKVMIETQQKVINDAPDRALMPISNDKAVVLFNRTVERLVREEAATDVAAEPRKAATAA